MKTDAEILTGPQMAAKVLAQYGRVLQKNWLLTILAVASSGVLDAGPDLRPLFRDAAGPIDP